MKYMIVLVGIALPSLVCAESAIRSAPLCQYVAEGFTSAELIKECGSPLERTEREGSREEDWRYAKGTVLLRDGKVVRFVSAKKQLLTSQSAVKTPRQDLNAPASHPKEFYVDIFKAARGADGGAVPSGGSPIMPPSPVGVTRVDE